MCLACMSVFCPSLHPSSLHTVWVADGSSIPDAELLCLLVWLTVLGLKLPSLMIPGRLSLPIRAGTESCCINIPLKHYFPPSLRQVNAFQLLVLTIKELNWFPWFPWRRRLDKMSSTLAERFTSTHCLPASSTQLHCSFLIDNIILCGRVCTSVCVCVCLCLYCVYLCECMWLCVCFVCAYVRVT